MNVVIKNKNKTNQNKELHFSCYNMQICYFVRKINDIFSKYLNDFNYSSPYY